MKLAKREKLFIGAAGCVIGLFLILELIITPYFDQKNHLRKDTAALENLIQDLGKISEVQNADRLAGGLESVLTGRRESLLSYINKEAEAINIKKNIPRMNPSQGKEQGDYVEDILQIEVNAVTLPQLTEFLYRIEKPERYIFISRISITDNKREEGYLDASIRVMTYKKKTGQDS